MEFSKTRNELISFHRKRFDNSSPHYFAPGWTDFSWYNIPKWGKIYQSTTKYTKSTENIPNARKIDQMSTKYINIFHCKTLLNLTDCGLFLKINHLATLFRAVPAAYLRTIHSCVG
jgi:hypothetical protein